MAEQYERERQLVAELRAKITQVDGTRALAAFNRVIEASGFDVFAASGAQFRLEAWDDAGFHDGDEHDPPEGAAEAWRNAIEAARAELCDKAPFVSAEAFGLVDFLGVGRGDLPTFPMVRRVG
jgi:hypothetical protein